MKKIVHDIFKFLFFKLLFPACYHVGAVRKRKEKAVFIELQGTKLSSNFRELWDSFEQDSVSGRRQARDTTCVLFCLQFKKSSLRYYGRCFRLLWEISDAAYLFVNDSCNVLGAFRMRKGTKLVQTWHACGAFKKWGFSIPDESFGESMKEMERYPYHRNYTFVTVSSAKVAWAYAEAFRLPEEKILPLGISRTDLFFKEDFLAAARQRFFELIPEGRKVILYAPTFRKDRNTAESPEVLDYRLLKKRLGGEYLFIERRHPFVKKPLQIPEELSDFVYLADTLSVEELLCNADLLITDYSSVVFEFSLFERPMLFLAHDLEEYFDERGFYYSYEEFVPGDIVTSTEEVLEAILRLEEQDKESRERVARFRQDFMSSCDGHATERIRKELCLK